MARPAASMPRANHRRGFTGSAVVPVVMSCRAGADVIRTPAQAWSRAGKSSRTARPRARKSRTNGGEDHATETGLARAGESYPGGVGHLKRALDEHAGGGRASPACYSVTPQRKRRSASRPRNWGDEDEQEEQDESAEREGRGCGRRRVAVPARSRVPPRPLCFFGQLTVVGARRGRFRSRRRRNGRIGAHGGWPSGRGCRRFCPWSRLRRRCSTGRDQPIRLIPVEGRRPSREVASRSDDLDAPMFSRRGGTMGADDQRAGELLGRQRDLVALLPAALRGAGGGSPMSSTDRPGSPGGSTTSSNSAPTASSWRRSSSRTHGYDTSITTGSTIAWVTTPDADTVIAARRELQHTAAPRRRIQPRQRNHEIVRRALADGPDSAAEERGSVG